MDQIDKVIDFNGDDSMTGNDKRPENLELDMPLISDQIFDKIQSNQCKLKLLKDDVSTRESSNNIVP